MASDLIASWENGRFHWYWYEDVIVELINNYKKEKEWYKVVSFIANDLWINDFESYDIFAEKAPRNVINRFWWQAKPPKSDLHIVFKKWNIVIKKWISIKSSNWSIQVQITNVKNFKEIMENNWISFSNELYIWLSKFCWFWEYKPSKQLISNDSSLSEQEMECLNILNTKTKISKSDKCCIDCLTKLFNLKQWRRNRWLIQELTDNERNLIKIFFTDNQKKIAEIVLKEWFSEEFYFADYYLVNNNEYSNSQIVDIYIENMDKVIVKSLETWYSETPQWSFHIWNITVQMKWSWKNEAFHWLQFNKRW